jgi:hypothetical protein
MYQRVTLGAGQFYPLYISDMPPFELERKQLSLHQELQG